MAKLIAGALALAFVGASAKAPRPTPTPLPPLREAPEVLSETEEYFHDLVFFADSAVQLSNGSQALRASGRHRGRPLAFEVRLGPTWKAGSLGKDVPLTTYQGTVTYHSLGLASTRFLQALDEIYGTGLKPVQMRADTVFTGISLAGDPRHLDGGPVRIKLFYEAGGEDGYAELYTNIDLSTHRLEIHEKDEAYRSQIIQALRMRAAA
jgi:hypothetical protein